LTPESWHLPCACTGAELELWSLRKKAGYFREVFGRELFVTLAYRPRAVRGSISNCSRGG
jgi:hypothetical protein